MILPGYYFWTIQKQLPSNHFNKFIKLSTKASTHHSIFYNLEDTPGRRLDHLVGLLCNYKKSLKDKCTLPRSHQSCSHRETIPAHFHTYNKFSYPEGECKPRNYLFGKDFPSTSWYFNSVRMGSCRISPFDSSLGCIPKSHSKCSFEYRSGFDCRVYIPARTLGIWWHFTL